MCLIMSIALRNQLLLALCLLLPTPLSAETIDGFIEPYLTVDLSSLEPGQIVELNAKPGQPVNVGDLLFALDTSVLEATLQLAREKSGHHGSLDVANAELELRRNRLQQITLLRQRGHATQRELSRAETDVSVAAGRLQLAEEQKRVAELECKRIETQIARRKKASPCSGVVTMVYCEPGEVVTVTDPRVMTIVKLDRLRARFSASPQMARGAKPDQHVVVQLAESRKQLPAIIERISPVIDAKSGTVEIHVVIENPDLTIQSGLRCFLDLNANPAGIASRNSTGADRSVASQAR